MPIKLSFKPQHIRRYREIAHLLAKFGLSEAVRASGLEDLLGKENVLSRHTHPEPRELAGDLEKMGPTFVKLGQALSTRADIVPLRYLDALADLQDHVGPFPYEEVENIVFEDLGERVSRAYLTFEPAPLAAASLGQVHKATVAGGKKVAVKIQRPHIKTRLAEDLEVLEEVASMLEKISEQARRYEVTRIIDDLRSNLMKELDYEQEAENMRVLQANIRDYPRIVVPQPIDELSSGRVLTMDFIDGKKITSAEKAEVEAAGGVKLADELLQCYVQQICIDGFFHADPHPGNVLLTPDGKIALLDLGSVGRMGPPMRELLLRLLLAVGQGRGEEAADLALRIGQPKETFNEGKFRAAVMDIVSTQHAGTNVDELDIGSVVLQVVREAGDSGLRVPRELTMLGKTMFNLDQIGRSLAPEFDPYASIRNSASRLLLMQLRRSASATNAFARAFELNEFVQMLPGRVNKILDRVANNRLELRVKSFDETRLTDGLQKVANRIAEALVIAALIVGASSLMGIETRFTILGYPGLAVLLFLCAAAGGVALIIDIWRKDRWKK